jgi:hypothetical protein
MKLHQIIHRWPWLAMIVMAAQMEVLIAADQDNAPPPPLTSTQLARVRELVTMNQNKSALQQARLSACQRALAGVYAQFELDEKEAQKFQIEIVGLQRQLLANHHQMQVEVRKVVGKERFEMLRRRLERVMTPLTPPPPTSRIDQSHEK